MAEETEILIYPDLRISDLKKDAELKAHRVQKSKDTLMETARAELQPSVFFKKHALGLLGTTVGVAAFGKIALKIGQAAFPALKRSAFWSAASAGLLWKLIRFSLDMYKHTASRNNRPT